MQGEAAQPKAKRADMKYQRLRLCSLKTIEKQCILRSFHFRYSKYNWFIGTYHLHKRCTNKRMKLLNKLSYITDLYRKRLEKGKFILYITKELNEDRIPHYHFLAGFVKDDWGCSASPISIRNTVLWKRKWKLGENFSFHSEREYFTPDEGYKTVSDMFYVTPDLRKLDMGAKQRWFKYGIYQYLLYIFKYSRLEKYKDYFMAIP